MRPGLAAVIEDREDSVLMRYFDASALVKRYLREKGSAEVRRLLASDAPATSRLSQVEVASALVRRAREGAYTAADRDRALAALDKDFPAILVVETHLGRSPNGTQKLLLRHELRAGDAIQLASGLFLQEQLSERVPFVAFDSRLGEAAHREGLGKASRTDRWAKAASKRSATA